MWRPHNDVQDAQAAVQRFLSGWTSGTQFCWLIFTRDTDELAGSIAARKDENGVNLGYLLARSYWGRGLMTEAVSAVVFLGFQRSIRFPGLGGLRRREPSLGARARKDWIPA